MIAAAIFALVTAVLLLLPLLPALIEWRWPTDAEPLRVVRAYDGSAVHFAVSFRHFIEQHMGASFRLADDQPGLLKWGRLSNGGTTLLIGRDQVMPRDMPGRGRELDAVVAAMGSVTLPANLVAKGEIYARRDVTIGARSACRAILSEHDLILGSGCAVLRWAHAEHDITTGPRARLWGRLTAGRQLLIGADSIFTRLHAARIVSGAEPKPREDTPAPARIPFDAPDHLHFHSDRRWVLRKSLSLPDYSAHNGDLITQATMKLGRGSQIIGSLKANRALTLERDCLIEGSVISSGDLTIGENNVIAGPVVGEGTVTIATGTVIGSAEYPTTITAPRIRLACGVVIYGSVWAREEGRVSKEPHTAEGPASTGPALSKPVVAV